VIDISNFSVTPTPTTDKGRHLIAAHVDNSRERVLQKQRYLLTELHDGSSRMIASYNKTGNVCETLIRSRWNCCRGKTELHILSVYAKRMRRVTLSFVACLELPCFFHIIS